jgi:hypothetical protein
MSEQSTCAQRTMAARTPCHPLDLPPTQQAAAAAASTSRLSTSAAAVAASACRNLSW